MRERDRRAAVSASRANPQPAIRNVIRPVAETVRAAKIECAPPSSSASEEPTDLDQSVVVRVIRRGTFYPGRTGDPTHWTQIVIEFDGKTIPAWIEDCSGRESDYSKLRLECYELNEIEIEDWYEVSGETLTYKSITPRNFRHVADVMDELIRDGSVSIR